VTQERAVVGTSSPSDKNFSRCSKLMSNRLLHKKCVYLASCKCCFDGLGIRLVHQLATDYAIRAPNSIMRLVPDQANVDRTLSGLEWTQYMRDIVGKSPKAGDMYNKDEFTAKQRRQASHSLNVTWLTKSWNRMLSRRKMDSQQSLSQGLHGGIEAHFSTL